MRTFEVTGNVYHERTVEANDEAHAIAIVRAELPLISIDTVGDRAFVGFCDVSGEPIFRNDDYQVDMEDGMMWLRCMADTTHNATAEDAR